MTSRLVVATLALAGAATACGSDTDSAADSAPEQSTPTPDTTTNTTATTPATSTTADAAAPSTSADGVEVLFPDVVGAEASQADDGTWRFAATLSSPYDTPERYADAWRIVGPDGTVYGIRELAHDHANEQPFTRSLDGVEIPDGITTVTVEGRDQVSGWGGATVEVDLDA